MKHLKVIIVAIIVILIEVALVILSFYVYQDNDAVRVASVMQALSVNIIEMLNDKMGFIRYVLVRNAAFFEVDGVYLSTNDYIKLLNLNESVLTSYVESYLWIVKLANTSVSKFQTFCERHIISNCLIKQFNRTTLPQITFEPVSGRQYYYPLVFAEPPFSQSQQEVLIGFDFNSVNSTQYIITTALSSINYTATSGRVLNGDFEV